VSLFTANAAPDTAVAAHAHALIGKMPRACDGLQRRVLAVGLNLSKLPLLRAFAAPSPHCAVALLLYSACFFYLMTVLLSAFAFGAPGGLQRTKMSTTAAICTGFPPLPAVLLYCPNLLTHALTSTQLGILVFNIAAPLPVAFQKLHQVACSAMRCLKPASITGSWRCFRGEPQLCLCYVT
jgi:hypothetical protein